MPRPRNLRKVSCSTEASYFKPRGIPLSRLEEIILTIDELESLRLTDYEGLYQEKAAEKMGISRQTLGRICEAARRKIADAIINKKALRIEGGSYTVEKTNKFRCRRCRRSFVLTEKISGGGNCPVCLGDANIK